MDVLFAAALTVFGFTTVALMAYFATRPEKEGPRCPRCLNRVKPAAAVCHACRQPLEWAPGEEAERPER